LHVFLLLLVVLIGPVLFKQIWPVERRQYDWVSLDETQYTEVTFSFPRRLSFTVLAQAGEIAVGI